MPVDLRNLKPAKGAVKERKRLGRGIGSGLGKTSGRGQKGAGSRTGSKITPGFEGGQMPLARRLPKRGFHNHSKVRYQVVSLERLGGFDAGAVIDEEMLRKNRVVKGRGPIKILSDGEIAKALTIKVSAVSAKAREKIVAAGGSVEAAAAGAES
ncbi:MAG TPA: 50S ribosomal protein L15 [Candidatus Binatia bacterium]|nr:50S ribosomal protein L15 [Candidatus Binatia bacterium]